MKTREITNKYGSVVIIDDVNEAKKVLAELKEAEKAKAAMKTAIAKKSARRNHRNYQATTFMSEERTTGTKANRAARRTARRATKKTAARYAQAWRLYADSLNDEIETKNDYPRVYPAGMIDEGTGISSSLQRECCKSLYGNEDDALFRIPGTNLSASKCVRVMNKYTRLDSILDFDLAVLDSKTIKWCDIAEELHYNIKRHLSNIWYKNALDVVDFTTDDGVKTTVIFFSESLRIFADLSREAPTYVNIHIPTTVSPGDKFFPPTVKIQDTTVKVITTEQLTWLTLNGQKAMVTYYDSFDEFGQYQLSSHYDITTSNDVTLPPLMTEKVEESQSPMYKDQDAGYKVAFAQFMNNIKVNHGLSAYAYAVLDEKGITSRVNQFFNMPKGAEICATQETKHLGYFGVTIFRPCIKAVFACDAASFRVGIKRYCDEAMWGEAITTNHMYKFVERQQKNKKEYMELFVSLTNSRIENFWVTTQFLDQHPEMAQFVMKIAAERGYKTIVVKGDK